jgi:hypothetical protein
MVIGNSYSFQLTITDVAGASGSAITGVTVTSTLLPVEFIYFKGQPGGAGNLLQWATAAEENSDYFSIERSQDGSQFESVGRVSGAGTNKAVSNYSYTDTKALAVNYYYRLKQVDKDGQFNYSKTILLSKNGKQGPAQVYPNPVQSSLSVIISNEVKGNGKISVYDITGHKVRQETVVKSGEILQASVDMHMLTPGLYLVEVRIGDAWKFTKSILKQ